MFTCPDDEFEKKLMRNLGIMRAKIFSSVNQGLDQESETETDL